MKQPNIILITTDQQRWDAVSANGNPAIRTPNMDRIAAEGTRYLHSFCAALACQPSRAGILTGTYPPTHGVMQTNNSQWVDPSLATLPGVLTEQGYDTVGVGKMHFLPWDALCGYKRRVFIESKYSPEIDEYRAYVNENDLMPKIIGHHTPGFGKAIKAMPSPCLPGDHIDAFIGKRATETVEELIAGYKENATPFFTWISFCGPHDPYDPPEPYASMYDPKDMPLPRRAPNELQRVPPSVLEAATESGIEKINMFGIPDAEVQRIRALYYGNVSVIDEWVGKILDLLDSNGIAEDTLVIFTSDHADFLGDHDLIWKSYLPTDSDTKVPLLMRWPGHVPIGVTADFSTNVDLMPTILGAAGAPVPEQCQGVDLIPISRGEAPDRHTAIIYSEPGRWRYRDDQWAFTWYPDQPFDTLYDLSADPDELNNLCYPDNPHPQAAVLKAKIKEWMSARFGS